MAEAADKLKALGLALDQLNKTYGKGTVMKLGQESPEINAEVISSGSIRLDTALGIGGFPGGEL